MLGQSYFQLISPLIFLIFSAGFAMLWRYARDIEALRWFAFSYFFGACAMVGDFLRDAMHPDVASLLLSALYLAAAVSMCAALYAFYRGGIAWRMLISLAAAVLVLFSWVRFGLGDMVLSGWAINAGIVAIYLLTLHRLHHEMTRRIDRTLQAVIAASAVLLLIRTAIVFWYEGAAMTESNYAGSLAAVTLQLFIAVSALAVAGVLFVMFGMEIVRRLTETSETDPLTGVLNRRGFEARVSTLAEGEAAQNFRHAVVMADLDRFKAVNDTFGHEAGDAIIKAFGRVLGTAARECDFVVRWGGEEFLVVIAHADIAAAHLFAEAARTALESMRHACLGGQSVTASFGIAAWHGEQSLSKATRHADMALYRAKNEGRNRVCSHAPEANEGQSELAIA